MVPGALPRRGTLHYSLPPPSVGSAAFTAIVLFIGGVIAATLVVSGLRLRRRSGPAGPRGPLGSHDRSKTEGGRCHPLVGDGQWRAARRVVDLQRRYSPQTERTRRHRPAARPC